MTVATNKGIGLRTKFKVERKGDHVHIKIKTKFSDSKPRELKCTKGQEKRCAHSKGYKCTCHCKGQNHGRKRRWPKILSWN